MNRIDRLFKDTPAGILSVYFCAGDPEPALLLPTLRALQDRGIQMIEIGVPFSDPIADGPVIQDAATRALKNGMSVRRLFRQLHGVRCEIHVPMLLMGYYNVMLQYGPKRFIDDCAECGIDGCIIPDMPFEEYDSLYRFHAEKRGVKFVFLVTPETAPERIRQIDEGSNGFIYAVSSASVTGAQQSFDRTRQAYFARLSQMKLKNPWLVGFGVSNRATREAAERFANGVIVGSKFVGLLHELQDPCVATDALLQALQR
ncbi:MAG: tryptophan synthase subunit alpha [Bacteroidaceae bacterium]|nr:tryptophan synthase subunit alpha [Bacteroidaceae bacterium]